MSRVYDEIVETPTGGTDRCPVLEVTKDNSAYLIPGVMNKTEEYVISFWVKTYDDSTITVGGKRFETTSTWRRVEVPFVASSTDFMFLFGRANKFYIYHAQLEAGTMATAWSKAVGDLISDAVMYEGTTEIDGGKIRTGTVNAEKLNVTSLSAITGNIGELTSGKIKSSNYSAPTSGNHFSQAGMEIDVSESRLTSKYVSFGNDGAYISGNIVGDGILCEEDVVVSVDGLPYPNFYAEMRYKTMIKSGAWTFSSKRRSTASATGAAPECDMIVNDHGINMSLNTQKGTAPRNFGISMISKNGSTGATSEYTYLSYGGLEISGSITAERSIVSHLGMQAPTFVNSSDRRLKNARGNLDDLETHRLLSNINIVNFTYISDTDDVERCGVYAQELRDTMFNLGYRNRGLVTVDKGDGRFNFDLTIPESECTYGVDYTKFIPYLIKGWQIHNNTQAELQNELDSMKARCNSLEVMLQQTLQKLSELTS